MDLRGKKLLLLGGIQTMCQVVNEAHKLGVEVHVTDYYEDSPAKRIADKKHKVSTIDVDAVVELCKQEGIDGVFTGYTDSMLPYCNAVCEKLGLPFWGNEENIDMCIDKMKFKQACVDSGVSVVPYVVATEDNYKDYIDKIEYPVVIKPVDNSGSRGVFKCFSKDEFYELCEESLSFSKLKEVLIEKMMDADNEFSVYYMLYNGKAYLSECGDRYVYAPDKNMAPLGQGMNYPSLHIDEWNEKMESAMEKFFADNQMNNGFCFVQGFYENGEFYIHEIGYRLCGGFAYKYVDALSGYNQVQQMIRYSLTGEMEIEELEKSNPYFSKNAFSITVGLKPGNITSVKGVEELKKLDGILEFCQLHYEGDEISKHGATARVFAYVLCVVNNKEQLFNLIDEINEKLTVFDADGNSLLEPLLEKEKISLFRE